MRSALICYVGAALLCGCDIFDPEPPFLRGVIASRSASPYVTALPVMFVDGVGIWPADEPCFAQAYVFINGGTQVLRMSRTPRRTVTPVDTGQLVVGRRVAIWITGDVLTSCPPKVGAKTVLLESQ